MAQEPRLSSGGSQPSAETGGHAEEVSPRGKEGGRDFLHAPSRGPQAPFSHWAPRAAAVWVERGSLGLVLGDIRGIVVTWEELSS